ncbi:MAG: DUF815 domain-containing protein, partial [Geminicoccaceae bacterium]|nr:DUF815 domain-containing protein [Geminicoccaceae bacterium]
MPDVDATNLLARIAEALERQSPPPALSLGLGAARAYVFDAPARALRPVPRVARIDFELLCGIDHVAQILLDNTRRFARGLPANNALLWGARGMGKSSLVKAVHGLVEREGADLILIEIHREDIDSLPHLLHDLARQPDRFLLFCDDLSFDAGESSYKSLKAVLEGG